MPSYTLKKIPEPLYERIRASAEENHRSINGEIIYRLERSLSSRRLDPASFLARVRRRREAGNLPRVTDEEIREARDSGRP